MRTLALLTLIFSFEALAQQSNPSHLGSAAVVAVSGSLNRMGTSCRILGEEMDAQRTTFGNDPDQEMNIVTNILNRFKARFGEELTLEQQNLIRNYIIGRRVREADLNHVMADCPAALATVFARDTESLFAATSSDLADQTAAFATGGVAASAATAEAAHAAPIDFNQSCEIPSALICDYEKTSPVLEFDYLEFSRNLSRFVSNAGGQMRGQVLDINDPCSCLRNKLEGRFPDAEDRNRRLNEAKDELAAQVVRNAGQKFMDEFASNAEDLNFFQNLRGMRDSYSALSCTDASELNTHISNNCALPENLRNRRLQLVFNSLGFVSGQDTVAGILEDFSQKTLQIETPGEREPFTRDEFDARRFSLSEENATFQTVDRTVARMLSGQNRANFFESLGNAPRVAPFEVMVAQIIRDVGDSNTLPSYFDISGLDEEKRNEIQAYLSAGDLQNLALAISRQFIYAMTIHPGLSRLLNSQESLRRVRDSLPANLTSLKAFTENQPGVMGEDFRRECDRLKDKLKNLVCSQPQDVLKGIPQGELASIIQGGESDEETKEIQNLLMCTHPFDRRGPRFSGIPADETYSPAKHSDLRARLDTKDIPSAIDLLFLAEQRNEDIRDEVIVAGLATEQRIPGWADHVRSRFYGDRGGRMSQDEVRRRINEITGRTQGDLNRNPASVDSESSVSRSESNESQSQSTRINTPQIGTRTSVDPIATPITPVISAQRRDGRNEGSRQPVQGSDDQREAERLRSFLTDEQRQEIDRLREEARLNRQRLEEITNETQRNRIQSLRNELNDLEQRAESTSPERERRSQSAFAPAAETDRTVASVSAQTVVEQGPNPTGPRAEVGSGSATTGGVGSLDRVTSSGAPQASGTSESIRSREALVITSSEVRSGDEIPQAELNQEIIRFLTQNNPGLVELTKIKENGMLYKFRSIVNGVEVEQEVFIQFDRLSPVARQAVEEQINRRRSQDEAQLAAVRRTYSYEALKYIVGQEILNERR